MSKTSTSSSTTFLKTTNAAAAATTNNHLKRKIEAAVVAGPTLSNSGATERLSSFRLPRDLTLGGVNPAKITKVAVNKKVYTPNLNAIRNKNSDVKTSRDTTQTGRGRGRGGAAGERGGRGGRGGGRGGKNSLVKTSGLFSEGSGEIHMRKSLAVFNRNSEGGGGGDSASSLRKPILVKREIKIDPDVERKNILDILGDDDEECDQLMAGHQSYATDTFTPIMLNEFKAKTIKTETEAGTTITKYPESLEDFFARNQPQLFLLQLPDSLPGEGPDAEPADCAESENKRTNSPDPAANYCTARQLDEGCIGKIVRYKSGATKLVIGDARFDVNLGMEPGLLQDVMSVNTNRTERSGNLINLGNIQAKLSAIPDWEYMFKQDPPAHKS